MASKKVISVYSGSPLHALNVELIEYIENLENQYEVVNNIQTILGYCGLPGTAAATILMLKYGKISDVISAGNSVQRKVSTALGYLATGFCSKVEIEFVFNYMASDNTNSGGYYPYSARITRIYKGTGWEPL
jgi:hypothetical protein